MRVGEVVEDGVIDAEGEQFVAVEVDGDAVCRSEGHTPEARLDEAAVVDPGGNQGDEAALSGGNHSRVANTGGGVGVADEAQAAGEEILVGDVEGGGDEPLHVDAGLLAEDDAVGVDQVDVAVGGEAPQDFGGIVAGDAVQGDR